MLFLVVSAYVLSFLSLLKLKLYTSSIFQLKKLRMLTKYRLSAQDALFSLSNHPLVHFFENKTHSADFMPTARLRDSLHCALKSFPILTGHIQETGDGLSKTVVVDERNPNLPDFTEASSSVQYNKLKGHHFNWSVWPSTVATAGPVTAPGNKGVIKLLCIHVMRLGDNSGLMLFCNIPHYILDGFGYYEFLCHWAMLCRMRGKQQVSDMSSPVTAISYVFDRSILSSHIPKQRKPLDSKTRAFIARKSRVSSIFAKLPYRLQTRLASTALSLNHANAHFFHVSAAALEELCNLHCSKDMPDIDLNPSGSASYAILVALFSMPIIQVLVRKSTRRRAILQKLVLTLHCAPQASDSSVTIINCIHAHKLLDMEDRKYIGNPVFMQPVFVPLDYEQYNENTLATAFANVVDHINAGVRSIDAPLLGGLLDTLDENPDTYAKLAISVAMGRPLLTFIDEREYRVGDVDFGCGSPSWVSAPAWNMPNFVAFLACPPGLDGTMVYTSLKDDIFERVSCNILFAKYARFLF